MLPVEEFVSVERADVFENAERGLVISSDFDKSGELQEFWLLGLFTRRLSPSNFNLGMPVSIGSKSVGGNPVEIKKVLGTML